MLAWSEALCEVSPASTIGVKGATIGASQDFLSEGMRRVMVNSTFWCLDMEVPERANADVVGEFAPTPFGFNRAQKGVRASDHALGG